MSKPSDLLAYDVVYCLYLDSKIKNFGYFLKCSMTNNVIEYFSENELSDINLRKFREIKELDEEFLLIKKFFNYISTRSSKEKMSPLRYFKSIGINHDSSKYLNSIVTKMLNIVKKEPTKWQIC
ncbi:MAG: hypothetical protein E6R13_07885 [Spirochaetes bacterium]|nr:MAG: hypothetical protein E6R13_07885 [Spirochaetota bacterium]